MASEEETAKVNLAQYEQQREREKELALQVCAKVAQLFKSAPAAYRSLLRLCSGTAQVLTPNVRTTLLEAGLIDKNQRVAAEVKQALKAVNSPSVVQRTQKRGKSPMKKKNLQQTISFAGNSVVHTLYVTAFTLVLITTGFLLAIGQAAIEKAVGWPETLILPGIVLLTIIYAMALDYSARRFSRRKNCGVPLRRSEFIPERHRHT